MSFYRSLRILSVVVLVLVFSHCVMTQNQSYKRELETVKTVLNLARQYKYATAGPLNFSEEVTDANMSVPVTQSHKQKIDAYEAPLDPQLEGANGRSPRDCYRDAIYQLSDMLWKVPAETNDDPRIQMLRTTIAEYLEAEMLLGNQKLLDAVNGPDFATSPEDTGDENRESSEKKDDQEETPRT